MVRAPGRVLQPPLRLAPVRPLALGSVAVTTAGPLNSEPWGAWIAFVTLANPRTYEGQPQLALLLCGRRVEDSPSCIDEGSQQGLEPVQGHVIVEFVHTLLQMGHPELGVWK